MSKIEINNEIVLMRHCVRQARLHVVRKLVRQVKLLRVKKGDEKQLEKHKRKADKLGQELVAVKKIPDDEISKFSITNQRSLAEILNNPVSDAETCVLARVAQHKVVTDRVKKFKEKFSNFEEHLGPGRRKQMKLNRKAGKLARKQAKLEDLDPAADPVLEKEVGVQGSSEVQNDEVQSAELGNKTDNGGSSESGDEDEVHKNSELELQEDEETETVSSSKVKLLPRIKPEREKTIKVQTEVSRAKGKLDKLSGILPVCREATVKSFTSFLEEKDAEKSPDSNVENEPSKGSQMVLEKEVDSFFMTENGDGEYLSIVVPKANIPEDDEGEETGATGRQWKSFSNGKEQQTARSRNERFFDKVNKIVKSGAGHNPGKGNRSWQNNPRDKSSEMYADSAKRPRSDFAANGKPGQESMHPSWAAKKKQQEILKQGFQGKKIVFDDV